MSGPNDPFDGDSGGGGDGEEADEELPWPQPEAGTDDHYADETGTSEDGAESRTARRAARSARVRRRRRVLFGIGGGLLVIVLAFVLWYELETHALGPPGPQVVVTVHEGESTDAVVDALSQQHVIGSSLAFQVSEVFHGTPSVLPGSYAMHQNLAFSEVRTLLAAGPNIYPVDVRPGFTFSEVAQQVDSVPGHAEGGFAKAEASGAVHSTIAATDPNNLEGMLGTGTYLILPDESDTTILTDMVQRFDHDIAAAGLTNESASALGMTPYQVLITASIVEKEGYIPVNMPDTGEGGVHPGQHARHRPGDLQPPGPGHAAADGLDRSVRAGPGRGTGDVPRPPDPVALQHLPQQRPHADTHLHAIDGCAPGRGPPAGGCLAVLRAGEQERHHGLL
jgi:hypothetical protein